MDVLQDQKKDCTLFRFDDWHQHDGYVTKAHAAEWGSLDQILLNDQTLHHSRHGDAYVRWGYYPNDFTFLLRYDVLDPDEEPELSEPEGDCDLCANADIIISIRSQAEAFTKRLEVTSAKAYFDRIYAG